MSINPYDVLGVDKTVSPEDAKKAFKQKAKTAHPDRGGDVEEFHKLSTAIAVITDPRRRKWFDDTGKIGDAGPDNTRAAALQVIQTHIAGFVNQFISSDFDPKDDPRKMNIPEEVAEIIQQEIEETQASIKKGKKVVAYFNDLADRFAIKTTPDADNFVARNLEQQARGAEKSIDDLEKSIEIRSLALKIVRDVRFRSDPEEYYPAYASEGLGGFDPASLGSILRRNPPYNGG